MHLMIAGIEFTESTCAQALFLKQVVKRLSI
jgi:hypothetical protein